MRFLSTTSPRGSHSPDEVSADHRLSRQSFTGLSRWLADCKALASPHLVAVLVGNKLDREEDREVEYAEGARWAQENGQNFWYTSDCSLISIRSLIRRSVFLDRRKRLDTLLAGRPDHLVVR